MKLVIAEKPSVAQSIAAALGVRQRQKGYLEGNGYLISWCYGHLAGLADADQYDPKYKKWRKEDLPIVPSPFRFCIRECRAVYRATEAPLRCAVWALSSSRCFR